MAGEDECRGQAMRDYFKNRASRLRSQFRVGEGPQRLDDEDRPVGLVDDVLDVQVLQGCGPQHLASRCAWLSEVIAAVRWIASM